MVKAQVQIGKKIYETDVIVIKKMTIEELQKFKEKPIRLNP